jgi:hypothetical protein
MAFGYNLDLSLKILSPVTRPVRVVMVLQYFPPLTGDGGIPFTWLPVSTPAPSPAASPPPAMPAPPPPPVNATTPDLYSYLFLLTLLPPEHHVVPGAKTAAEAVYLHLTSVHSLGSVAGGSKLRIVFPLVVNEELTPAELPFVPPIIGEHGSLIKNPPPLPKQLYPTDIAPATTEYFGIGEDLSNFQVLSGDPPALTPNRFWSWNGLSNVTVLAQDLVAADAEQKQLFWSGILIGVAGGGAIAFALELIGLGEEVSKRRKDADEATQKAALAAPQ